MIPEAGIRGIPHTFYILWPWAVILCKTSRHKVSSWWQFLSIRGSYISTITHTLLHVCTLWIHLCARKAKSPIISPLSQFAVTVILDPLASPYWFVTASIRHRRQGVFLHIYQDQLLQEANGCSDKTVPKLISNVFLGKSTEQSSCPHLEHQLCSVPKKLRPQNLKSDHMRAAGRGVRLVCLRICVTVCVGINVKKEDISE